MKSHKRLSCEANTNSIHSSAESAASTPVSYQITISSFDADGNGVPTQQFTFTATGLLQNMEQAILSDDFRGLDRVELDTDAAVNTLIATLFDDYECVVYKGERPHSKNPEESSKPAESESLQEMPSSEEAKKPEASECSNQTTGCEESKSSGQWL